MINLKFYNFIRQLKKTKNIDLTAHEKLSMRNFIFNGSGAVYKEAPIQKINLGNFMSSKNLMRSPYSYVSFAVVIFLALGGLSFASEFSLPGDPLYPIKTKVNENTVRLISSFSPEKIEKFEVGLVDKRLHEVEELNQKNKLTDLNIDEVKKGVILQSIRAENVIKKNAKNKEKNKDQSENSEKGVVNNIKEKTEDVSKPAAVNNVGEKKIEISSSVNVEIEKDSVEQENTETSGKSKDSEDSDESEDEKIQNDLEPVERVLDEHLDILKKLNL